MTKSVVFTISILLCAVLAVSAAAEVLLIEEVRESQTRHLPQNGITMAQTEAQYGNPLRKHAPVGQPPITRWEYSDFSVYFEHNRVLSSVAHRRTGTSQANR